MNSIPQWVNELRRGSCGNFSDDNVTSKIRIVPRGTIRAGPVMNGRDAPGSSGMFHVEQFTRSDAKSH